jgi:Ras-related protein Rab-8A
MDQTGQPRPLQMGAKGAYIVRLLMVGDSSCGKTSLVLRFDQNVFSTKFVTTIGVDYRDKMVKVSIHHILWNIYLYYISNDSAFGPRLHSFHSLD